MGKLFGGGSSSKAPGPDPETVRLQREQSERLAEREKAIEKQEQELALNEEKKAKRKADVRRAGKRGLGGLLSGGFEGFRLSEPSKLT